MRFLDRYIVLGGYCRFRECLSKAEMICGIFFVVEASGGVSVLLEILDGVGW